MAGAQQALVEEQVVAHVVAAVVDSVLHAGVGGLEFADVLRGGALSSQAHRSGLDQAAQLLQVTQEIARQPGLGLPSHHIGVEPVPLL